MNWTPAAEQYVRDHYQTDGATKVANTLGFSRNAVRRKAFGLNMRSAQRIPTQKLLMVVARTMPPCFTPEALAVAAWQAHPERFGMRGFPQHPDHHAIVWQLCGKRGMVERCYLMRHEDGTLSVVADATRVKMERIRALPECVQRARASTAFARFQVGHKSAIGQLDALDFWGGTTAGIEAMETALRGREDVSLRELGACHDYLRSRHGEALCKTRLEPCLK